MPLLKKAANSSMAGAHPTGLAKRLLAAALLLLGQAAAFTYPNQTQALLDFKHKVLQRGPNWVAALEVSPAARSKPSSLLGTLQLPCF